jgi:hypothetical protein
LIASCDDDPSALASEGERHCTAKTTASADDQSCFPF